jgi:hypothetical protein
MSEMECRLRMRYCQCGPWFKGACPYKTPVANTQPPAKGQCPPQPEREDGSTQVNPGGSDVR